MLPFQVLKIRLLYLLFCCIVIEIKAQNFDLEQKISYEATSVTLHETLKTLKEITGIAYAYNNAAFSDQTYSWKFPDTKLRAVLDEVTRKSGYVYELKKSYILIRKKQADREPKQSLPKKVKGVIKDSNSKEPLPFATVRIKGTSKGVVSNEIGEFLLNLSTLGADETLEISYIGYYSKEVKIPTFPGKVLNIEMEQDIVQLQEIEIMPKDPTVILKEAIDKIEINYQTTPFGYEAYYRELVKVDSTFVKYADAAAYIYNYGYHQKNPSQSLYAFTSPNRVFSFPESAGQFFPHYKSKRVKIIEARASDNLQVIQSQMGIYDFEQFNISNGLQKTIASDYVKGPNIFLNPDKWQFYDFELDDYESYIGKRVYVIKFEPKGKNLKKATVSGTVYIDIESSAIIAYELEAPEELQKKLRKVSWIKFVAKLPKKYRETYGGKAGFKRTMTDYNHKVKVEFQEHQGKWYLSSIRNIGQYHNYGTLLDDIWFETTRELVINQVITDKVPEIPEKERFSGHLFDYPISYSPRFWENYNSILPTEIFSDALQDLEKEKSLDEQFRQRVTKDTTLLPPVAKKSPTSKVVHGHALVDDYQWLHDPYKDEVRQHIRLENDYTKNYMIPLEKSRRELYQEMVRKVKKNDESVPVKIDEYYYYAKHVDTLNYPIYCRKLQTLEAKEEVIQDVNLLAKNYEYYDFSMDDPSPNHDIIPFYENLEGGFDSVLKFKNLTNQSLLNDSLHDADDLVWFESGDAFLYTKKEPETKRTFQIFLHQLGTSQTSDVLVFEESDPTFSVNLGKSKSDRFIFITSSSKEENETHVLDAKVVNTDLKLLRARQSSHLYHVTHVGNTFYVASNQDAPNFQIFTTPENNWNRDHWKLIVPHHDEVALAGYQVFDEHLVIMEKSDAQDYLKVIHLPSGKIKKLKFGKVPHVLSLLSNADPATDSFRFSYEDPLTPTIVYDYDFASGKKTIVKQYQVQGPYDPKEYEVEKIHVTGHDGVDIPVTLIYRKGAKNRSITKINGKKSFGQRKLYLTSYGAYGISSEPYFSYARLSLLDKSVIYAIAHVRGGGEKGKAWYEQGKFLHKKNTFKDFISVAEHLIAEDYVEKGRIIARGGSAGGLLVGAVVNERPDLLLGAILEMPFLDVVNTMMDESLPLTTGEYKEWGNPKDKQYFDYMLSYWFGPL